MTLARRFAVLVGCCIVLAVTTDAMRLLRAPSTISNGEAVLRLIGFVVVILGVKRWRVRTLTRFQVYDAGASSPQREPPIAPCAVAVGAYIRVQPFTN
jgi:hypothetical protein